MRLEFGFGVAGLFGEEFGDAVRLLFGKRVLQRLHTQMTRALQRIHCIRHRVPTKTRLWSKQVAALIEGILVAAKPSLSLILTRQNHGHTIMKPSKFFGGAGGKNGDGIEPLIGIMVSPCVKQSCKRHNCRTRRITFYYILQLVLCQINY